MLNSAFPDFGPLQAAVDAAVRRLRAASAVERLWRRDGTLWSGEPPVARKIEHRLGWLELPSPAAVGGNLQRAAERVQLDPDRPPSGRRIVLLGMGGSSLAPEVMAQVLPRGAMPFTVLDSTAPEAIRAVEAGGLDGTLYIVSSKSGTTVETRTLAAYFQQRVREAARGGGGGFLAITDEGTSLAGEAAGSAFSGVVLNDPDIGGRYSALSNFGLIPAGLCGVDVRRLVRQAALMAEACRRTEVEENPGAMLGAVLGGAAAAGRDKVTLILSPALAALGAWIEQLLAESTGKEGRGLLPVDGEPLGAPGSYGADRLFVRIALDSEPDQTAEEAADRLARAGHPVVRLTVPDRYDLGAEFFRWEVATALAGFLMGINPFDEPNVQQSKDITADLLTVYRREGRLPEEAPTVEQDGIALSGDQEGAGVGEALDGFLRGAVPPQYVALLAFLPRTAAAAQALTAMRRGLRNALKVATTHGFGPRYLHSTGQLFKGGPGHGRFVVFTAEIGDDLPIPGVAYTFGTLLRAQALGDVRALRSGGRRVVRVHLRDAATGMPAVAQMLAERFPPAGV
ncbi:MAG: hypothetical protein HY334_05780 [Armatimonadetes bacterium]|nr:hypothetical protein [Armatimonadota bacterium]